MKNDKAVRDELSRARMRRDAGRRLQRATMETLERRQLLATFIWDGGAGNGSWNDPMNWDPDMVPGPGDDAIIDVPEEITVTVFTPASINSLVSDETIRLQNPLTINSTSSTAGLEIRSNGILGGAGDLTITEDLLWERGNMASGGATILAPGATGRVVDPELSPAKTLGRTLRVEGELTTTSRFFNVSQTTSLLHIAPGATLELRGVGGVAGLFSPGQILNEGLIQKTFGGTSLVEQELDNQGIIEVESGTLDLRQGPFRNDGTIDVPDGSVLRHGSGGTAFQIEPGSTLSGAGDFFYNGTTSTFPAGTFAITGTYVQEAGTLNLNDPAPSVIDINAGTLNLNTTSTVSVLDILGNVGGSADVTVTDAFAFRGGQLFGGNGRTVTLAPTAAGNVFNGGTWRTRFVNQGTLTHTNGSLTLAGVDFLNDVGSEFVSNGNGGLFSGFGGDGARFDNLGTFRKDSGAEQRVDFPGGVGFVNAGLVDVTGGDVEFARGFRNAAGGIITTANGRTVEFSGATQVFEPGSFVDVDGTFRTTGSAAFTKDFPAGTIAINGTLDIDGGRTIFRNRISPQGVATFQGASQTFFVEELDFTGPIFANGGRIFFDQPQTFSSLTFNGASELGGSAPVTFTESMTVNTGTFTGPATMTLGPDAVATFAGQTIARPFEVLGDVTQTGTLSLGSGGSVRVAPEASWTISGPRIFNLGNQPFVNEGLFRKVGGGLAQLGAFNTSAFDNRGDFEVLDGELRFRPDLIVPAGRRLEVAASAVLEPQERLENRTTNRDDFDFAGTLRPRQAVSTGSSIEVASQDRGATAAGFQNNFVVNTFEVGLVNAVTNLADAFDNSPGSGNEAMYVDRLVVLPSRTLNLNGLNLYARDTQIDGNVINGTVTLVGDGGPLPLNTPTTGEIAVNAEVDTWTFFGRAGQAVTLGLNPGSPTEPPVPLPPVLGNAQVEIVDPLGNVIASGDNDVTGANTSIVIAGVDLPTEGTYSVRVSASPADPAETGSYVLTVFNASVVERPLTWNTPTTGTLPTRFAVDRYAFTATAGDQVQFDLSAAASSDVVFDLFGPNGFVGFTEINTSSGLVNLTETGEYALIARGRALGEGGYRFALNKTSVVDLLPGTTVNQPTAGTGDATLFRVPITDAQPLRVTIDDADDANRNVLYARFGEAPTRRDFDFVIDNPSADQQLLVPVAASGDWFVLLVTEAAAGTSSVTASAEVADAFIDRVTPGSNATNATPQIVVEGAGFVSGTTVSLVQGSTTIAATEVTVDTFGRLVADVDLTAAPLGDYDVVVTLPGGGSTTAAEAFEVLADEPGDIETRLILPNAIRPTGVPATFFVEYENAGNTTIAAPILRLQSADENFDEQPLLTLDEQRFASGLWSTVGRDVIPEGFDLTASFLAQGESAGLLHPGEVVRVPVYFVGFLQSSPDNVFEFEVRIFDEDNTEAIDYADIRLNSQPSWLTDDAWQATVDNLEVQIGPTWGDYVQTLSANARQLDRLGTPTDDIAELWNFEVLQASASLSPLAVLEQTADVSVPVPGEIELFYSRTFLDGIESRQTPGPHGFGWRTDWDTRLVIDADGNVDLFRGGVIDGRFEPDGRFPGRYFSLTGDARVLFGGVSGSDFTLTSPDGGVTTFDAVGRFSSVADRNGNAVTATYDIADQLYRLDHTSGGFLDFTYDANGRVETIVDSLGRTTTYGYDASGDNLLSVTTSDGRIASYTYSSGDRRLDNALLTINDNGVTRTFEYEPAGKLAATFLGIDDQRVDYSYDNVGVVTATDALGIATQTWFGSLGEVLRLVDGGGDATQIRYDDLGRVDQIIEANGVSSRFDYTRLGNLAEIINPLGATTRFEYAGPDELLRRFIDARGNAIDYAYDADGNLTDITRADGTRASFVYDTTGEVVESINRRRDAITFDRNAAGQVTRETRPDGRTFDYTYDPAGRVTTVVDSLLGTTTYTYASATNDSVTRIDQPDGRFLVYTYDADGRRESIADQDGFTTVYVYDDAGRIDQLEDGSSNVVIDYTYDDAGRLTREDKANGTASVYAYDAEGRLERISHLNTLGGVRAEYVYTYDIADRRTSQVTPEGTWTYGYDAAGQLVSADFVSNDTLVLPDQTLVYEYDAVGNRTRTFVNGVETLYAADAMNQYATVGGVAYLYDDDGNLLSDGINTYTWDADNRLVGLVTPTSTRSFTYDAAGNRVLADRDGDVTSYLVDLFAFNADGSVVAETDGGTNTTQYRYGNLLANAVDSQGSLFAERDGTLSVIGWTDPSGSLDAGFNYTPFGDTILSTGTVSSDFGFVGSAGLSMETGQLVYGRARYYESALGRYLSEDPIGLLGGLNLYRYGFNAPTNFIDINGRAPSTTQTVIESAATTVIPAPAGQAAGALFLVNEDTRPGFAAAAAAGCGFGGAGSRQLVQLGLVPGGVPTTGRCSRIADRLRGPNGGRGAGGAVDGTRSIDPNDKIGPGAGETGRVRDDVALAYRINFENFGPGTEPTPPDEAIATAPAQRVDVVDQLDARFDYDTFEFTSVGWGDFLLTAPAGADSFFATQEMTFAGVTFDVEVAAFFNTGTGEMRVSFQAIDAGSGLPPDAITGFLPPEDGTGRGKGFIEFLVEADEGQADSTEIRNVALITFDGQEVIATNQINPIDPAAGTDPAKEALITLDALAPEVLEVRYEVDAATPQLVIELSEPLGTVPTATDLGLFNRLTNQAVAEADVTVELVGSTVVVTFNSPNGIPADGDYDVDIASTALTDLVGRTLEADVSDAFFVLAGDANRDRTVNLSDFGILRANFGLTSGALFSQADFNYDGAVDLADFGILRSNFGTTLPAAVSSLFAEDDDE